MFAVATTFLSVLGGGEGKLGRREVRFMLAHFNYNYIVCYINVQVVEKSTFVMLCLIFSSFPYSRIILAGSHNQNS
jgi:hypothetical protein